MFCELEERCNVPFDDSERMKKHHKKTDVGNRLFLTPAMVTNGVLAAELALKETGTFDCIHDLDKLFYALLDHHWGALSS